MIRRPPRSTRTDTLVPYTTLFRSAAHFVHIDGSAQKRVRLAPDPFVKRVVPLVDRENDTEIMVGLDRSEEHTSELQSLMRLSYAVFCLKKKTGSTHDQLPTMNP